MLVASYLKCCMSDRVSPAVRKIIHIDMDAFYASVEQRDNPALKGVPVAVGGARARGVVAAASYEARTYGVRSAMPAATAIRRCPDLVFVRPRFDVYRDVSEQIRRIFRDYTELVEPLSLDEAYLDVSNDRCKLGSAQAIAEQIRDRIRTSTGLTASAGVSYNKFIAKLASDQNKPDGQCIIPPAHGPAFVASLPVKRFHGVGPVTAAKMANMGILTGADLAAVPLETLARHFGTHAVYLYRAARGEDDRPVRPDRVSKSIGAERTFEKDLMSESALRDGFDVVARAAWARIFSKRAGGRTVTLKVRYSDFHTITRARSFNAPITSFADFCAAGTELLERQKPVHRGIRLLGLTLSGLSAPDMNSECNQIQSSLPFDFISR